MPELHIERLTLKLGELSEQDGRRLALLVTDGLAQATGQAAPSQPLHRLQVSVPGGAKADLDQTARLIVAEVLRQLQREP